MNKTRWTAWTMTAALVVALGACAGYVDAGGGYVEAGAVYPMRAHYYEPAAPGIVYFYDTPDVVVHRHYYRENDGRSYYFENDRPGGRRLYYDNDRAAKSHGPDRGRGSDRGHDDHR